MQDNCPVALAAARSCGVSTALFAPGWVFEEFPRDSFEPRQEAFWDAVRAGARAGGGGGRGRREGEAGPGMGGSGRVAAAGRL